MRKVMSTVAAVAASMLMLVGCSGSSDSGASKAPSSSAASEATTQAAEAAAFPVTVKANGHELKLEKQPERIVVFDMAALDTLDVIGAGKNVVGTVTKSVPTWLKDSEGIDYSKLESVGSLKEPDMEALAKIKPDLVILGARSAKLFDEVSKTFPTIDASVKWDKPNYSERVPENIRMLGTATGFVKEADKAAKAIEDKINSLKGKGKGTAIMLMSNAGEISMHGLESRYAPIWDVLGFKQVEQKADEGHKGQKISFETVKELNPDYIFVLDRDAAVGKNEAGVTAKQVMDNDLVKATTAGKEGHIYYLSPERWYIVMTGASNFLFELDELGKAVAK